MVRCVRLGSVIRLSSWHFLPPRFGTFPFGTSLGGRLPSHIQQCDAHSRVRTVPTPTWVKVAIDAWTSGTGSVDGRVFRPVNRGDTVQGEAMSEKVVWQMLQQYATDAGVPGIAPHDCRRSCAKLCRAAGESLSKSSCSSATPRFKRPNDTSARSKIW